MFNDHYHAQIPPFKRYKLDIKITFFSSLKGRVLLFLLLPTLLIIAALITITTANSFSSVRTQAEISLKQVVNNTALHIKQRNASSVSSAKQMVLAQDESMFGNRGQSIQYARRILVENPQYIGTFVGYEPNADQQDKQFIGQGSEGSYEHGRFLAATEDSASLKMQQLSKTAYASLFKIMRQ